MPQHRTTRPAIRRLLPIALGVLGLSGAALAFQWGADRDRGGRTMTGSGDALVRRIAGLRGGETLTLEPGDYGAIAFPSRTFSPAIRLDARAARFTRIEMKGVGGVTISGGTVAGTGGRSYGVQLKDVRRVTLDGMTITGAHRGIVIGGGDGITLSNNRLTGLQSDGIDIAGARNVIVRGNSCRDFTPTPTTFDANGKRLTAGDHPDCIQAWSRPGAPTSDILVENNDIEGKMQGIFFGNHVRNGVDDGGFDRVTIRNNRVRIDHPNGIMLASGRNSAVHDNRVSTLPGSMSGRVPRPTRVMVRVKDGAGTRVCGNAVADFARGPGTQPC